MKKCVSLFAAIMIIAILAINGRNSVKNSLAGDPSVGTIPLPKVNGSIPEQIIIKAEMVQFRFEQEYMI